MVSSVLCGGGRKIEEEEESYLRFAVKGRREGGKQCLFTRDFS